jgi:hypothetical protein
LFLALFTSTAHADTVSIGLQQGGGIATVATGSGTASFNGAFGSFSSVSVSGHGQTSLTPPDLLFSNNIETATAAGGTLMIWITDQDLISPTGTLPFTSSFTSNLLPAGWTLTESTFLSSSNALFAGAPLSSANFNAIGTNVQTANAATGPGPYSVTEEFIVTANGAGDANNTIDLSAPPVATPEPSALACLALGILSLAAFYRRARTF